MYAAPTEVRRRHHRAQRRLDRTLGIGEEVGDASERFVRLGVEHMQDRSDQQRMAGLLPMVPPFQRALRVDQNIGDVLDVTHLPFAAAHFKQRVVRGALRIRRIEQQHGSETGPPAGSQSPVLAFDVVDDRRSRPGQEGWNDQADALAASGRRETQHMLGTVVAEVAVAPAAEEHAVRAEEAGMAHFTRLCPARGPVGRAPFDLPRPPDRHGDGHDDRGDAAGRRDIGALDENITCVGVVGEPPPEEGRRLVDGPAEDIKPGVAELRLEAELPCGPFRRSPDEGKNDGADEEHLSPEDLGRVHGDEGSAKVWGRTASAELGRASYRMLWRTNRTVVKVGSRPHNCRSLQSQRGRVMPRRRHWRFVSALALMAKGMNRVADQFAARRLG